MLYQNITDNTLAYKNHVKALENTNEKNQRISKLESSIFILSEAN